jgi:Family of unknown function (DUF6527)
VKAPVPGRLVIDAISSDEPGVFNFSDSMIYCNCPCGCGSGMVLPIYRSGEPKPGKTAWEWNGNEERPTLKPSIRDMATCYFHGFLTDGVWSFCGDSGTKPTKP